MSVNKVILVGHLGADPESRATPSGLEVCNLSLATNHTTFDRNTNERNTTTEWHRVVMFGRQAEVCAQYLRKGSQIYIEGRIQTRKYTDRDGIERYSTEIIGERMQMLGGRGDDDWGSRDSAPAQRGGASQGQGGGWGSGQGGGGGFEDNSRPMPGAASGPSQTPAKPASPAKSPDSFDSLDDDLPF